MLNFLKKERKNNFAGKNKLAALSWILDKK
jgi:hypothetical protein